MKQTKNRLLLAVLIFAASAVGQNTPGAGPTDIVYANPGKLVSVKGTRLNLYCMGSGSPTVVFDSGWEDWAPAWAIVQPRIAKWTRACSYDRAGAGFSEAGPMPRNSVRIAHELHTALHNAGIAGPYILVGSTFGGDNMRVFANRYMPEVAGLVMVDADPDEFEPAAAVEEQHRGDVGIIPQLRACRNAVAEHKPLPMLPSRPGQPQRTCAQQFFRGLPEAEWSAELNAKLRLHRRRSRCMTLTYPKWSRRHGMRRTCSSTAARLVRGPFACSPPATTVSAIWKRSLQTPRNT